MTDTNRPATPSGHQLVVNIDGNVLQIAPDDPSSGPLVVNTFPDSMTYWEWSKTEPYQAGLYLESSAGYFLYFYLYYTTSTTGRCIGYYYNGNWNYIGSGDGGGKGTFTDQNLN